MFDNLKIFLEYRKYNKIFSKALKIKRDIKIELYFLFGLWKNKKWGNILKRNCRCYLAYYKERGIEADLKNLNYIAVRISVIYKILYDKEILKAELNKFKNIFSREYVENKINELILKNDASMKNLVEEAVI